VRSPQVPIIPSDGVPVSVQRTTAPDGRTRPIPIQSEPPTLVDERARVWRTLAGFENGAPFWLLLRCARLPAGRVRHALRQLTAVGDVIAKSERGEIRYCIR
jgi:hypothetical protein